MHRETTEKIARVQARYKVLAETYNIDSSSWNYKVLAETYNGNPSGLANERPRHGIRNVNDERDRHQLSNHVR